MLFIEMYTLTRAWTDLTDEEFFWEPLPGCWSVRQRRECLTPTPFGKEDWMADFHADLAERAARGEATEPLTTVAWLMWHIASMPGRMVELDFLASTRSAESGWTSPYIADHPVFASADEAVQTMRTGWRALDRELQGVDRRTTGTTDSFLGLSRASRTSRACLPGRRLAAQRDQPPWHPGVHAP
jgi:hypothetical protein